tara:strand:+ start:45 stop:515 length:471 start_codon:yes stop_codon:yes gene_type:complete
MTTKLDFKKQLMGLNWNMKKLEAVFAGRDEFGRAIPQEQKTQKRKINKSKVKKKKSQLLVDHVALMKINEKLEKEIKKLKKQAKNNRPCVSTSTISTQTDFDVLNMSGDSNVKRNKMTNLANKDKRAWLRAEYGKKWYEPKDKKAERVARWKAGLL